MPFASNERGAAAVEFAMVAPALILLALAACDLVQFFRVQLRLDAAATQLGQIVSQCNRIRTPGDTDQFWSYANRILAGIGSVTGTPPDGAAIISAVYSQNGANWVAWQQRTGDANYRSSVGTTGGTATLAEGFIVPAGQTLFVTEIFLTRPAWVFSNRVMGDVLPSGLNGTTLFMTRAPDAPSLQQPPAAGTQPDCTG